MDNLPDHLIIEILSRLSDSTDVARCRCVSKTLNTLALKVRSIYLHYSKDRFTKMRWTRSKVTPFKSIFHKLISDAKAPIESVSLGVDKPVDDLVLYDDLVLFDSENVDDDLVLFDSEIEENVDDDLVLYDDLVLFDSEIEENVDDDLFLTAGPFTGEWTAKIGHGLKSIAISDFSSNKKTNILDVLSNNCHSIVELTLEDARLTVDDMNLMPLLTRLTLKYVKLFDESLNKLMVCLPCLQVLILIDSGGGTDPKIYHSNLKELNWALNNCCDSHEYLSSLNIFAPNLTNLELQCDYQIRLSIHAPLLSYCNLDLWRLDSFDVAKFKTLKTLRFVAWDLHYIHSCFPSCITVQNLTFESLQSEYNPLPQDKKFMFSNVFTNFPNVTSLTLGSEVWSQLMMYPLAPLASVAKGLKDIKQFTVYLVQRNIDKTLSLILYIVGVCSNLTDIVLFIHRHVDLEVVISFVSSCMSQCPKVRFRWGTWKEGTKDRCMICISNSIISAANMV